MNSDGSRKTPRRKRSRTVGPPARQRIDHRAPRAPHRREHGLAGDDVLSPTATRSSRARRQEHVHARAELHQADPLAALQLLPFDDAADDAARQDADDLPDDDGAPW